MVVGATGAITEREQPHKLLQTEKRWRERKRENRQTDKQCTEAHKHIPAALQRTSWAVKQRANVRQQSVLISESYSR